MLSGVSGIIAGPFSVELIVLQTCSDENIVSKKSQEFSKHEGSIDFFCCAEKQKHLQREYN